MKFYRIGFFILLLLILVFAAYYLGTMSGKPASDKSKIFTSKKVEKKVEQDISPTKKINDLNYVKENLKAAIEVGNHQPIESYMADKVNVILEASECCGEKSGPDAALELKYLYDAVGPWNFDQSNETIKKLKEMEPEKYGPESAYIGISSNEYTVSFKFNSDNKVNGITMAATYKLIIP